MTEKEICAFLDDISLFSGIFSDKLPEPPSEVNLRAGDKYEINNSVVVVYRGKIDIYKKNAFLKRAEAPSVLGLATLFEDSHAYISTIVPKTDTTLLVFSQSFIDKAIKDSPDFSRRLIELLIDKIRYLNKRIDFYTSPSAEGKLYEYLHSSTREMSGEKYIEIPMSRLSGLLDIGRASLYRAISALEEKGKIIKQGKKIILIK